jgi:hypothetical protein
LVNTQGSFFLKTGVTFANFQGSGKTPDERETLKSLERGADIDGAAIFRRWGLIPSEPIALLVSREFFFFFFNLCPVTLVLTLTNLAATIVEHTKKPP